jgi:elongator complex protein 3
MQDTFKEYLNEIIEYIKEEKPDKVTLSKKKIKLCSKYHLKHMPNDIKILMSAPSKEVKHIEQFLSIKPVRTISGVSVVAIMTKPLKCPGTCIYCPGGVNSFYGDTPKSYTGQEPAARRAARNHFDSYLQIFNRLEHYIVSGHAPDKVELIVMGATFPAFDKDYQEEFIYYAFKAMNDFSELFYFKNGKLNFNKFKKFFELPAVMNDSARTDRLHKKLLELKKKNKHSLKKEQEINKSTKIRCVGLTIETRPDYANRKTANDLLNFGTTRIELGIQSVYEDVLKNVKRGHTVKQSIESISILRDLGFKLNFHMMPGLPGVDTKRDLEGLKKLFSSQDFRPDMLKIYPCMVMPGTELYKLYQNKKFKPLTTKKAAILIANFKKFVPKYVRIMRVQRDIPSNLVSAGVDKTNLRQYVEVELKKKRIKCNCIRCREIKSQKITNPELNIIKYEANNGTEFFISIEDNDKIVGFCRLRFPAKQLRKEFTKTTAIIRELHIYGETTSLGKKGDVQHSGFGKILLKTAEEICKENNYNKLLVISGIGVRGYYSKFKYNLEGPYMSKKF